MFIFYNAEDFCKQNFTIYPASFLIIAYSLTLKMYQK